MAEPDNSRDELAAQFPTAGPSKIVPCKPTDVTMADPDLSADVEMEDEDVSRYYVYNTNTAITPREMKRLWTGGCQADNWNVSFEEHHADQVDHDRGIVDDMEDDHPVFVRLTLFLFFIVSSHISACVSERHGVATSILGCPLPHCRL